MNKIQACLMMSILVIGISLSAITINSQIQKADAVISDAIEANSTKQVIKSICTQGTLKYPNAGGNSINWLMPKGINVIAYKYTMSAASGNHLEGNANLALMINGKHYEPFPMFQRDIHANQTGYGMDELIWLPHPVHIPANSTYYLSGYWATVDSYTNYLFACSGIDLLYIED